MGLNRRRRLFSKSAPLVPLQGSCPSDLLSKQLASGRRGGFTSCYKVLNISRWASPEEVRQAFRRRALTAHPDKLAASLGRLPTQQEVAQKEAEYRYVAAAFDLLSDSAKRAAYDAELFRTQEEVAAGKGCAQAVPEVHAEEKGEARLLLEEIINNRDVELSGLRSEVLLALRELLERKNTWRLFGESSLDPCLKSSAPRGEDSLLYWVIMSVGDSIAWTNCTPSLEQALAWRGLIALLRDGVRQRVAQGQDQVAAMEEEVTSALRREPGILIKFHCKFMHKGKQIVGPLTQNWHLALEQKRLLKAALARGPAALEQAAALAKEIVKRDRLAAEERQQKALAATVAELERREAEAAALEEQERRKVADMNAELLQLLGFTSQEAVADAILKLRQVPAAERQRRQQGLLKTMLEPQRALTGRRQEALLAPQASQQVAPRPPEPQPQQVTPRPAKKPRCFRELVGAGRQFLPRDVSVRLMACLGFQELNSVRAGSCAAKEVVDDVYWQRCQSFRCPDLSLEEARFSCRGRRLAPKKGFTPLSRSVTLLAQPRLAGHFEHVSLHAEGRALQRQANLLPSLLRMPHLCSVDLPTGAWDNPLERRKFIQKLQRRGVRVQLQG